MPDEDISYDTLKSQAAQPMPNIWQKLLEIQQLLKVEKGRESKTKSGTKLYNYRSKEDILEAVKPLCHERGLVIMCTDTPVVIGERYYIVTSARVKDVATGDSIEAEGWAREDATKSGMDGSQITGTAASYAGKRALGNLFAIDDTKDSDALGSQHNEKQPPSQGPFVASCQTCGTTYEFHSIEQYNQFLAMPGCCPNPHWAVV